MGPVLTSTCRCGERISVPCPTVADIGAARAEIDAAGWGHDERGFALCPKCLDVATSPGDRLPMPHGTRVEVIHGDCREVLQGMGEASVDSVVTDPPYHLTSGKKGGTGDASVDLSSPYGRSRVTAGFMNQKWDGGDVAFRPETWAEVLRVMKPGAHLVAFSGTRTWHRLACAIEDAGFEIRDSVGYLFDGGLPGPIIWAYGTGFPKSLNVSRALDDHRCLCHLCDASSISTTVAARPVLQPNVRGIGEAEAASPQDMHGLRGGVDADHERAARPQSDVLASVQRSSHLAEQGRANPRASHDALCRLWEDASPLALQAEEADCGLLLAELPGQGARGSSPAIQRQHEGEQEEEPQAGRGEPGMEGRGHVPQPEGQLRLGSLREVPAGASEHGPNGRVRDGAPAGDGAVDRQATPAGRVRASRGPRPAEQSAVEPDALAGQPQPQDGGAWPHCGRCGKPIVPDGLGTALKPSFEPIVLARKPLACPTVAAQVLQNGCGALNVDGCRVATDESTARTVCGGGTNTEQWRTGRGNLTTGGAAGRWPANLVHNGSPEVLAAFAKFGERTSGSKNGGRYGRVSGIHEGGHRSDGTACYADTGTAARFFPALGFGEDEQAQHALSWLLSQYSVDILPVSKEEPDTWWAARTAGHQSRQVAKGASGASVRLNAQERLPLGAEVSNRLSSESALHAPNLSEHSPAMIDSIAPLRAAPSSGGKKDLHVNYADSPSGLCVTNTARNHAPIKIGSEKAFREHFTSATESDFLLIVEALTTTISNLEQKFSRKQRLEGLTLSLSHARSVASRAQSGTMTITISLSKSDGFAESVTFGITSKSEGVGDRDSLRFSYSAKANKLDRCGSRHPCVKPQSLLRWLCRLITPPGGLILDPFSGSGSLGEAALAEGFSAVLVEREAEYVADCHRRLGRASGADTPLLSNPEDTP